TVYSVPLSNGSVMCLFVAELVRFDAFNTDCELIFVGVNVAFTLYSRLKGTSCCCTVKDSIEPLLLVDACKGLSLVVSPKLAPSIFNDTVPFAELLISR